MNTAPQTEQGWQPIDTCPDDWTRVGGQRLWRLRERSGRETVGRRKSIEPSGFVEKDTNRELDVTHWRSLEASR